jgi:excisionase family DNA binding protein
MICPYCQYKWLPRKAKPKACPRCKARLDWIKGLTDKVERQQRRFDWFKKPTDTKPKTNEEVGKYMNVEKAAKYLSVHPYSLYRWLYQGLIPYTKVNNRICIAQEDIKDYIKKHKIGVS